jgi:3-carboxy-cis,cis-muconate cycloisomerase
MTIDPTRTVHVPVSSRDRVGLTGAPFSLLERIQGDPDMAQLIDEASTVDLWVRVEVALAAAQSQAGILDLDIALAIAEQAPGVVLDLPKLWDEARVVGYPILPLLNQLVAGMSEEAAGRLHFGATTQDIMDTALALQLVTAGSLLVTRLDALGDGLARRVALDRPHVIAARTHAQQATSTTLGAKWAVFLSEFARHRTRLVRAIDEVGCVSLFGAGGTSAAMGDRSAEVRRHLADELGLHYRAVPWHVSRDSITAFALACAGVAASTVRLAREVVDLGRTEVGEVSEVRDPLRGASSTMPQKANPILSEAIIGFGGLAASTTAAVLRAVEAGHERAAGEWQIEWGVLPQVLTTTSSALRLSGEMVDQMIVYPERMLANLSADGGALMSESLMISLAEHIGRDRAHETVYQAVRRSRESGRPFAEHVSEILAEEHPAVTFEARPADPAAYIGEADAICDASIKEWEEARG